jgi:pimeloyl-ACP methyl ester carboxylesterase
MDAVSLAARGIRSGEMHVDGLRTRVLETGPADASEAIVFLHGGPGSASDWEDLLPQTGAFARSVAFDLPGFGWADKPRDWAYSHDSFADFIGATLSLLRIGRAHLVMSDLGGAGLFWAATHPQAFASAVMINTGVLADYRWHWVARLHRTPILGELVALTARSGLRAVMSVYGDAPLKPPAIVIDRWRAGYDWGTRRAMLRFYRASPVSVFEHLPSALRRLDRPALVLWGARDPFVSVEHAQHQRKSFPDADVVVLHDSGHYPHLDDPPSVASALIPFLRQQLSRPPVTTG